ncbi:serine hydrolase domain-containing protein [Lactiplantibacillus garii]|uniref:serine hydrolase domain-containing protein n=1 Tax=Lactiplantibacillus garii TaxID=2306423 RepID=UPI0013158B2C|nr:serine hydrolase domain-containing protein [Lactiplantibacillus garii]
MKKAVVKLVGLVTVATAFGQLGIHAKAMAVRPVSAQVATTVGKHTTSKYQKRQDAVKVRPAYRTTVYRAYDLVDGTVGSNQRINFKTKYRLNQLNVMYVDHRMNIDNAVYYHFTTTTGQKGWVWRGYTQAYTPKNAVRNRKAIKKTVYVQPAYRLKTSNKKVYNFKVVRKHTNFISKYKLNKFTKFKVTKQMTVKNAVYYYVTSAKSKGWVWRGYTTPKKPLINTYLATEIKQIMNNHHLRGKVLVINGKQNNRDLEGYGYANYGRRILNNKSNVLYQGASLQKAMTGAMMVQLITESQKTSHKMSQNTAISRWYPNLTGARNITVGNLLTQTSGIMDSNSEKVPGWQLSEQQAVNQAVSRINRVGVSSKSYHYNNDNYILLAGIIRAYTGKSYEYNLQKRIIKPLGLKHTYMWNTVSNKYVKARSYKFNNKNYQQGVNPNNKLLSYIIGAGNMYTTPNDYYTFERGLQNGKILNYADYQYLTGLKTRSGNGYSGGMYVRHNGNIKVVYGTLAKNHVGNWVQLTKTNGQGIILFTNQSNSADDVKQAGYEILSKFSNQFDAR